MAQVRGSCGCCRYERGLRIACNLSWFLRVPGPTCAARPPALPQALHHRGRQRCAGAVALLLLVALALAVPAGAGGDILNARHGRRLAEEREERSKGAAPGSTQGSNGGGSAGGAKQELGPRESQLIELAPKATHTNGGDIDPKGEQPSTPNASMPNRDS